MLVRVALSVVVLLLAPPARAQQLVPTGEEPAPFHVSSIPVGPVTEGGALVFFGSDIGTQTPRAVVVGPDRVSVGAGLDGGVVDVKACGGVRWLLGFESHGMRGTRWSLRAAAGPVVWSQGFPTTALPDVRLRCAAGRAILQRKGG